MDPEQKETPQNITFKSFVKDNASNMFGLDRRLWGTLKLLLFYPGKLTKAYLNEGQSQFTAPTTLYFSVNFLFFLLQPFINSGRIQLLNFRFKGFMANEGLHKQWIESGMAESGLSALIYEIKLDAFISFHQPALIFIMIPFMALLIWLIELKRGEKLVFHTVHAFHFMTFFLLLFLIVAGVTNITSWMLSDQFPNLNRWLFPISMISVFVWLILHLALSFRQLGTRHWFTCLMKSIGMTAGFFVLFLAYINVLLLWAIFNVS